LISETKDALCIASTVSKDNSNARLHIPKAWIKKRKVIKFETTVSKSKRKKATAVGERPDTPTIPYAELVVFFLFRLSARIVKLLQSSKIMNKLRRMD